MTSLNTRDAKLETVPNVDLKNYAGKWYEIATFPQGFQKGCHCTKAEYTPSDKGYVIVENRSNKDSINGKQSYIKGRYWIIDFADDYSYSVVSHSNRKYLWILSRTPKMDETV